MQEDRIEIKQTQNWVQQFILGMNLCPFASRVVQEKLLAYRISDASELEDFLEAVGKVCVELQQTPSSEIDTVLLILPQAPADFLTFLEYIEYAEALMVDSGLEGVLQLVSFHPGFQFFGVRVDDSENYTNRSPYPTLHFLREDSVTAALDGYKGDPAQISARNIQTVEKIGYDALVEKLKSCLET